MYATSKGFLRNGWSGLVEPHFRDLITVLNFFGISVNFINSLLLPHLFFDLYWYLSFKLVISRESIYEVRITIFLDLAFITLLRIIVKCVCYLTSPRCLIFAAHSHIGFAIVPRWKIFLFHIIWRDWIDLFNWLFCIRWILIFIWDMGITFSYSTLLFSSFAKCTRLSLTWGRCLLGNILCIIVMLTYGEWAVICLSVCKISEDHSLALIVLCRRHFFISAVKIFIDSKQMCDGWFVRHLFNIYLIDLLHDVNIKIIDGSLSSSSGSCEGTLDHLWLLHVLLCYFIESDNLLLHYVEFSLEHFDIFLSLFVVLLDCVVLLLRLHSLLLGRLVLLTQFFIFWLWFSEFFREE